jgi:hypothetical protein
VASQIVRTTPAILAWLLVVELNFVYHLAAWIGVKGDELVAAMQPPIIIRPTMWSSDYLLLFTQSQQIRINKSQTKALEQK